MKDDQFSALSQAKEEIPSLEVTRQAIIDMLVKHHVIGAREAVDRLIAAALSPPQAPSIAQGSSVELHVPDAETEPRPACKGECNPFVADCGARFCTYEDLAQHLREWHLTD